MASLKKLLLLLLLSFGLISSANSKSNIPLPSNQDFIAGISQLSSILEKTPYYLEQKHAELEAEQKLELLLEQYDITIDEEEKYAINLLINKE